MSRVFATVIFGLAASLCWGSGDFNGGLASRRANSSSVVIAAYGVGFVLLVGLAMLWREPFPSLLDLFWGGLAGLAGAIGLISFYSALSIGRMGIAAPVSAVLTAFLPVLFSAFIAGLPSLLQLGGFVLALLAIALISRPERAKGRPMARFTSVLFLLIVVRIRQQPVLPKMTVAPLVLLAGVLDAMGNAFFILAAHSGRLDVAAVLSSLYPAATVLLAALLLRERVTRVQAVGILLALIAVPLISA